MSETFCGKSCEICPEREANTCQGCRVGPGNRFDGSCEISQCAREKGHTDCSTCGFVGTCGKYRGKDTMLETRNRAAEREAEKKAGIAEKAPILGKWLWVLFWLVVPNTIASLMTNNTVLELIPALEAPGNILSAVCALASCFVLWQLREITPRYKTAAVCSLIASVVDLVLAGVVTESFLLLILGIGISALGLYGQYQIFYGHAEAVEDVDGELSEKWVTLWTWYIGVFIAMFVCLFLALISPGLAIVALIAVLIAAIVVGVRQLMCLYEMAKLFREYDI